MRPNHDVSVSPRTLAKLRQIATARGLTMGGVLGLVADSLNEAFVWRGITRTERPRRHRRFRPLPSPRPGQRYSVPVPTAVHVKLSQIANHRGLTMAKALELVIGGAP